jgi:hypothetical protein
VELGEVVLDPALEPGEAVEPGDVEPVVVEPVDPPPVELTTGKELLDEPW